MLATVTLRLYSIFVTDLGMDQAILEHCSNFHCTCISKSSVVINNNYEILVYNILCSMWYVIETANESSIKI